MAEDNTVFLCKSCKPVSDDPTTDQSKTPTDGFACNVCEFKSAFKYNLGRHMDSQHGGLDDPNDGPEPETELGNIYDIDIPVTELAAENVLTLEDMLKELGLSNLLENFTAEGVDMDMLKSLNNEEMEECMKEVGVKRFGDRHNILQHILIEKRKVVAKKMDIPRKLHKETSPTEEPLEDTSDRVVDKSTVSEPNVVESLISDRSIEETVNEKTSAIELTENTVFPESHSAESQIDPLDELVEETVGGVNCKLCKNAKQHECRTCLKPVCNLVCSEPSAQTR